MPVFLERFILSVLATIVAAMWLTNPMSFDMKQKVTLSLALGFLALFVAQTVHRHNQASKSLPDSATSSPTPEPSTSSSALQSPKESPAISQKNENSTGSQQAGRDIINYYPPSPIQPMSKPKQDPTVDNSISNSPIINSPGSIQAPGGTVTVHQGPPTRKLTEEQQATFTNFLKANAKGNVSISCVQNGGGEACTFARQLANLLTASGWIVTSFDPMMAWGDPNKTIPDLYIQVRSNDSPPQRAIILQHAFKIVGHNAVGFAEPGLSADDVRITVSTLND